MTRGDLRTLVVIICTAIISSVGTAIVAHLLIAPSHARTAQRDLEARVTALEVAQPALPAPVVVPVPAPPPPIVEAIEPLCDEVSCVLDNYTGTCCAKFHKGSHADQTTIDRAMISDGVSHIKARIAACGDRSAAKGKVKVSVKVGPDGAVTSVTLRDTPDEALGTCVVSEMRHAKFAKTDLGGSFSYPFIF